MSKQSGGVKPKAKGRGGTKAVAAVRAGKSNSTRGVTIGVILVVVLAVGVFGALAYLQRTQADKQVKGGPAPVAAPDAPAVRNGVTVTVGNPEAAATVDVYEDFLCPGCGTFENVRGPQLEEKISKGTVKVTYHMLPMLIRYSNPPGYSAEAANATLCSVDSGKFTSYHKTLFARQPKEGSAGYSVDQLVNLGKELGIKEGENVAPAFESCVREGTYKQQMSDYLETLDSNPVLHKVDSKGQPELGPGGKPVFRGTPTVVVNNKAIDYSKTDWLDQLG